MVSYYFSSGNNVLCHVLRTCLIIYLYDVTSFLEFTHMCNLSTSAFAGSMPQSAGVVTYTHLLRMSGYLGTGFCKWEDKAEAVQLFHHQEKELDGPLAIRL